MAIYWSTVNWRFIHRGDLEIFHNILKVTKIYKATLRPAYVRFLVTPVKIRSNKKNVSIFLLDVEKPAVTNVLKDLSKQSQTILPELQELERMCAVKVMKKLLKNKGDFTQTTMSNKCEESIKEEERSQEIMKTSQAEEYKTSLQETKAVMENMLEENNKKIAKMLEENQKSMISMMGAFRGDIQDVP